VIVLTLASILSGGRRAVRREINALLTLDEKYRIEPQHAAAVKTYVQQVNNYRQPHVVTPQIDFVFRYMISASFGQTGNW